MTVHAYFTRMEYLREPRSPEEEQRPGMVAGKHRRYYSQFVNEDTILYVLGGIGRERLLASTDPHFNDIPIKEWDGLVHNGQFAFGFPYNNIWRQVEDYPTQAGLVCIVKEAARQYVGAVKGAAARGLKDSIVRLKEMA